MHKRVYIFHYCSESVFFDSSETRLGVRNPSDIVHLFVHFFFLHFIPFLPHTHTLHSSLHHCACRSIAPFRNCVSKHLLQLLPNTQCPRYPNAMHNTCIHAMLHNTRSQAWCLYASYIEIQQWPNGNNGTLLFSIVLNSNRMWHRCALLGVGSLPASARPSTIIIIIIFEYKASLIYTIAFSWTHTHLDGVCVGPDFVQ